MDLIVSGIGWAGERHVQAAKALEREGADVHVTAVVDVDAKHLAQKAAECGVAATYPDLPAALSAHPEAGAVVLATPHDRHREGAEQSAAAGRHVLVEKPMALTLEDADAMIAACERAGTTLMVAESIRYDRRMQAAHEVIRSGRIGQVLSGHIERIYRGRRTYAYPGRRAWLSDPERPGSGVWMLNGIHIMSAARMLLGEVTRIDAREVHSEAFESPLEATVVALVSFDSGAVITMTISTELKGFKRFGNLVIFGSEGTLECGWREGDALKVYTEDAAGGREPEVIECTDPPRGEVPASFVREMAEFLAAIREQREPFTGGRGERATLAAIVAGYESMRTGQAAALDRAP